jgi:hypothetical protein
VTCCPTLGIWGGWVHPIVKSAVGAALAVAGASSARLITSAMRRAVLDKRAASR